MNVSGQSTEGFNATAFYSTQLVADGISSALFDYDIPVIESQPRIRGVSGYSSSITKKDINRVRQHKEDEEMLFFITNILRKAA
jgi:hypothetical protein